MAMIHDFEQAKFGFNKNLINLDELTAKANEKKPLYLTKDSFLHSTLMKPDVQPRGIPFGTR